MSIKTNVTKALGLGVVAVALSAGASFAAVATSSANVRSGPGLSYHWVDRLERGEFVSVTDRAGGWCEISHPGRDGWVSCALLVNEPMHRYDSYDRFHGDRHGDYPRYRDSGPSVEFNFGVGGPGMHFRSGSWH
jgi:hypothetical protein